MITPNGVGFRRILVCLDRSEAAEQALPVAQALARADTAAMLLVHVIEAPDCSADAATMDALEWEIHRAEAHAYVQRVVESLDGRHELVDVRLAEGSPPERVAAIAADVDAGLIVLTTRGSGGPGEGGLGATAYKILQLAGCPVLTVPTRDGASARPDGLRRILVPLDGSVRSLHVLPTVIRLARTFGAEVLLATVVKQPVRTELLSRDEDFELACELSDRLVAQARRFHARIQSQLEASGVRARSRVRRAPDHRDGLVELARAEGVDLAVMSAHGSDCNPRRRFGTVPSYFMVHAGCPLLVLQDLPRVARRSPRWSTSRLPSRSFDVVAGGA